MATGRLLIDSDASGPWNMAVDEVLLASAGTGQTATLRFYRWHQPALSLGYFQRLDDRRRHPGSQRCPLVRRTTGGGAILHDQELTYSLAVPVANARSAATRQLYYNCHQALAEVLIKRWGVPCRLCESPDSRRPADQPFLCFLRRSEGDLLCGQYKIAGSAQRRHKGAVLQHGSLLLDTSPKAPELPGVTALTGVKIPVADLIDSWSARLEHFLGGRWLASPLRDDEHQRASSLADEKFGCESWTERR